MHKLKLILPVAILLVSLGFAAGQPKKQTTKQSVDPIELLARNIPSPGEKNIVLATFLNGKDTVKVREFDVFGVNRMDRTVPQMLSKSERDKKIKENVFYKLLSLEGEKSTTVSSEEYLSLLKRATEREASLYLFEYLIVPRIVNQQAIDNYYKEHKDKFPGTKESGKNKVFELLKQENAARIAKIGSEWLDSTSAAYGLTYNDSLLKKISGYNFITQDILAESLNKLTETELSTPVLLCQKVGVTVNLRALVKSLKEIPPYALMQYRQIHKLKELINGTTHNLILASEAEKHGLLQNSEVVKRAKEFVKPNLGYIEDRIRFVDGNFIPTKKEMLDYFDKNNQTDKDLWCRRKMSTSEIFMPFDDADADSTNDKIRVAIEMENILQKVKSGEDFDKYARLYHRKMSSFGFLDWIFKDNFGLVGETAAKMQAGEISEVIYHPIAMSIIKVEKVNEARPYAFEYVEEIIKKKLVEQKKQAARTKLQAELNKKYRVKFIK